MFPLRSRVLALLALAACLLLLVRLTPRGARPQVPAPTVPAFSPSPAPSPSFTALHAATSAAQVSDLRPQPSPTPPRPSASLSTHRPPSEPRVRPNIPRDFPADADRDRIEDALASRYLRAASAAPGDPAAADLDALVEVELVFERQVTQHQLDSFVAEGGRIAHVFASVSYGWTGRIPLRQVPGLPARLGAALLQIEEAKIAKSFLMQATRNGRARAVWSSTFNGSTGYDGSSNIAIAILDSGVDSSHTDLSGRRVYFEDYSTEALSSAADYNGHGTHVAGIATGTGSVGGSGSATFYFSEHGDLSGVGSGSFLAGVLPLTAVSTTWAATAKWTGGGSDTLKFVYNSLGSNSFTIATSGTTGTSTSSFSYTFTPSTSRGYSNDLPSVGGSTVSDYVISTSVTNHAGVGDGFNKFRGVAPGCNWIDAKVATGAGTATTTAIGAALDDMVSLRETYDIKVLNMSLGLTAGTTSGTLRAKVNTAVDNGIVVVAAAGNDGESSSTITDPGAAAKAITVGAANGNIALTSYTSLGETSLVTTSGQETDYKPDLIAPGGSARYGYIFSTDSNTADGASGTTATFADQRSNDYTPALGTSMATPFVAGVAALVIDALETSGAYTWDFDSDDSPTLVKLLLNATATETNANREGSSNNPSLQRATSGPNSFPVGKDRYEGYGMVNADAAVEACVRTLSSNGSVTESFDGTATGRRAFARKVTLAANQTTAWSLTVPSTGDYDLYLYSMTPGTYGKPTVLASSTNAATDTDESISYTPSAATTAFVVVKRVSGSGSCTLASTISGDSFSNPLVVSNLSTGSTTSFNANFSTSGSNNSLTTETNEPSEITSNGGQSVWYSWTSNYTGTASLAITGGQKAQVYTGTAINALTTRGGSTNSATQTFAVAAGTTYRIAVFGSTAGSFTLAITPTTLTQLVVTNSTSYVGNVSGTGSASPSYTTITLSNVTGTIAATKLALNNITTTNISDFDIHLLPASGDSCWVISDVGGNNSVSGITLTLSDSASGSISGTTAPATGSYKPTDIDASDSDVDLSGTFSSYTGSSPNGNWRLWVKDDTNTSTYGDITGGWTLTFDISNGPVLGSTSSTASYTEDDSATLLQSSLTVTDTTSDYNSGSLTVQTTANSETADVIAISSQGTGSGQIGTSGSNVTYGGTTIGTYTGGSGSTALVITFNASSTPAAAQALLRRITYASTSQAPSSTDRTVTFTLADGNGGSSSLIQTVSVVPQNDTPTLTTVSTLTGASEDTAFTISYTTLAAAANEADADGTTPSFRIEAVSSGTLTKNGSSVTAGSTTLASGESLVWTPASNANGTLNAFTVKAYDGTAASSTAVQVKVTVTAVNDNPTLTAISTLSGAIEDSAFTISYTTLAAASDEADVETASPSFRIEAVSSGTLTKNGSSVTAGSTTLASGESLVWTPASNANGTLNAFTVKAYDGTAASSTAVQVKVTATAVNDSPTLTAISTLTGATEDTAFSISYTTLAAAANEADVDGTTPSFRIEAISSGTLTKSGSAVTAGSTTLASGESLVWTPAANANGTLSAFTVVATDGIATSTPAATVSVTVTAVNDAPTLTSIGTINGATEDTAFTLSYTALAAVADEADVDGTTPSFRIESVSSGTLTKSGSAVTAGSTTLASGESLVWTPAANANGTLAAFTVKAYDGTVASATAYTVNVAVASVADPALWDGGAATGAWGTAANWLDNSVPLSTDNVSLTGATPVSLTLDADRTVAGLSLSGDTAYTLASGTPSTSKLILSAGGTFSTTAPASGSLTHTISAPVALGDLANASVAANASLKLSGAVTGSGTLTKTGAGTLVLTGGGTMAGNTTVSEGTLQIGDSTATAFNGNIVNNSTVVFKYSTLLDYSGVISGPGNVTQNGSSNLRFTADNTFTGTLNVVTGNVAVGGGGATGSLATASIVNAGNLIFNRTTDYSYAGNIGGTGTLYKVNTNTLTLTGSNTYNGNTNIEGGTLLFSGLGNLGTGVGYFRLNNGTLKWAAGNTADLTYRSDGATVRSVRVDDGGGTFDTNGNEVTLANPIANADTDAGPLTKTGSGTLTLSAANTYTGATTVKGGVLAFSTLNNLGAGTALALDGGTFRWLPGSTVDLSARTLTVSSGGGTLDTNGNDVTLASAIGNAGSGAFTKAGSGILTLSAAPTYTGATTVSAGTLRVGNGGTAGGLPASITTVSGGATLAFNRSDSFTHAGILAGTGDITKLGVGTLTLTGANTFAGTTTISAGILKIGAGGTAGSLAGSVINNGTLTFSRSDAYAYSGTLSGSGFIFQSGTGTLTLSGSGHSASGQLGVSAGSLILGGSGSFGSLSVNDGTSATLAAGVSATLGTVSLGGDSGANSFTLETNSSLSSTNAYLAYASGASGSATVFGGEWTISGTLGRTPFINGGTASLTISGAGTVTAADLAGGSSFTTTLNEGTFVFSGADTADTNWIVASGAGIIQNDSSVTLSGVISGTGALTKAGSGTLTLTGANTHSGTTTVNAGTLQVGSGGTVGSVAGHLNLSVGTHLIFDRSDAHTFPGNLSGSGDLAKNGAGTLTLNGDAAHGGGTVVNAGTLQVGDGGATGSLSGSVELTTGTGLAFNRSGSSTFAGTLSGPGTLSKSGPGTVSLAGNVAHTGGTTIEAGTLQVGNGGTEGALSSDVTINGSGTLAFARTDDYSFDSVITSSAQSTLAHNGSGTLTLTQPATVRTLTVQGGGILRPETTLSATGDTYIGSPTGAGTLVLDGSSAQLALSGTYVGFTSAGRLEILAGASLSAGNLAAGVDTTGEILVSGAGSTLTATHLFADTGTASLTVSSDALATVGTLTAIPVSLDDATLAFSDATTSDAPITLAAGGGTVSNDLAVTLSTALSGAGAFTKTGAGTLTLSAAPAHTGGTAVNAGTLSLPAATHAGAITVGSEAALIAGSGATFSGDLYVNGSLDAPNATFSGSLTGTGDIDQDATVSGGLSPHGQNGDSLRFLGDLALAPTAFTEIELHSAAAYDYLHVGNVLTLDGRINIVLDYTPDAVATFQLLNAESIAGSGFDVATDLLLPELPGGFAWDTSALLTAGELSIVVASTAPTFAEFQAEHFSAAELADESVSGADADPDGDGLTNLDEYAFFLDPRYANPSPIAASVTTDDGSTYLTLTYTRIKDASDLVFATHFSSDLGTWSTDSTTVSVTENQNGSETVVIRDTIPLSTATPRRFGRIEVTQ